MPRLNTMALPQARLNIAPFQAAVFKPQTPDINVLARSLDRLEQREMQATDKISAMDVAFSQMRDKLHNDPATMTWFNNFSNEYKDKVNALTQEGRYGETITAATRYAADAVSNPELQARVRSNEEYEDWKKQVSQTKASPLTKERWLKENPYSFTPAIDAFGNVTGGETWNTNNLPGEHYQPLAIQSMAEKMAAEAFSSSGENLVNPIGADGKVTTDYLTAIGSATSQQQSQIREKTVKKLENTAEELLKDHPEFRQSLLQDYDDVLYTIDKLKTQLESETDESKRQDLQNRINIEYNSIVGANGQTISPEEYMHQSIYPQLKNMAYRNTGNERTRGITVASRSSKGNETGDNPLNGLAEDTSSIKIGTGGIEYDVNARQPLDGKSISTYYPTDTTKVKQKNR